MIPVTILTGFLGSGKTTLLNRILQDAHGQRIAVIENEFGETGIDNELLLQDGQEQIIEMNNGCICCTVRGDLIRILGELAAKREAGQLNFDRVIIETTGLADPAPVAQTFFVDDAVCATYLLDAVITVVDAKHAMQQLDEHHEAQEQVGFADRLLISKVDLVDAQQLAALKARLRAMNARAPLLEADFGRAPVEALLDIKGFNLNAILDIEPDFLQDVSHHHDDDVSSFVFSSTRPMDAGMLDVTLGAIIEAYAPQLMRYKGLIQVNNADRKVVLQGVHMMVGTDLGAPWRDDEVRETRMVFIGKNLPRSDIESALTACLV
jgi:G3E family GTPase